MRGMTYSPFPSMFTAAYDSRLFHTVKFGDGRFGCTKDILGAVVSPNTLLWVATAVADCPSAGGKSFHKKTANAVRVVKGKTPIEAIGNKPIWTANAGENR